MTKGNMRKTVLGIASAALIGAMSSTAIAAEKVAIGTPSWTGAQAIAHLIQAVVVERIGGEATLGPANGIF